ncbi:GH35 family beta-galactosidase [Enterococcus casseliflavus]|uniref:GH35 family beta-galactosidase n=1 Tax=Enterococcus casseliflavus TaxID=37734 RepID=UPI00177A95D8|nr:DUF5597 domain-containing protein [Enterococcus casseliflavus]QOG29400.1 DUF5597 domain-containing protein [Enterococcus casseliflavus]
MVSPYLKEMNGKKVLIVNEKPFLILAGEVHNSSSSSSEYMSGVWEKADNLGMNSVLLPVTWENIEPAEGAFDFSLVDQLITQAREYNKKIVLLWFGSWKNAQCYYAPSWVKRNTSRFKRAEVKKGQNFTKLEDFYEMPYTTLSYLCEETRQADARAFKELMKHIKEYDAEENTVIMVQVENEPGLQGAARENSDEADELFQSEVPADFVAFMKNNTASMAEDVKQAIKHGANEGNWTEVFGEVAAEIFSSYHVATYINTVAAAGKKEYALPLSVNCWLDKGQKPGMYPSGGPVSRMMEVWKFCADEIDVIAPDIYVPNFLDVCDEYIKLGNPLFIPETVTHAYAGPRQVYVVGHYHALGYAPFGFEDMGEEFSAIDSYLFGVETTDPLFKEPQDVQEYQWITRTLNELSPLLAHKYGTTDLQAVSCERKDQDSMVFGEYGIKVMMDSHMNSRRDGVCLALKIAEDEFYVLVNGCIIHPLSLDQKNPYVGVLSLEEGRFEAGNWKMHRRLNGDEVAIMRYEKPTLLRMKLYSYK